MKRATGMWMVAAGFVCALVVGEVVVRQLDHLLPPSSSWPTVETEVKNAQLADVATEAEVVLLGSSVTEAAVDPELLMELSGVGLVYNAALPFSSPLSHEVWLNDIVLAHAQPSVVLIGIPAWPVHSTVSTDHLRSGIESAAAAASNPLPRNLALISNKGVLADWDVRRVREALVRSGPWTSLGHQVGYYEREEGSLVGRFPPFGTPNMSRDNVDSLRRIVTELTKSGVMVVLMIEPGRFPGVVSAKDRELYLASIVDLGEEFGVPVWDTNSLGWESDLFVDEAHFNREGTVAFTAHLSGLLRELIEK